MALAQEVNVLEILKRAKSGGEVVPWNQDVREEALRRNAKAGYCNSDGSQISADKGDSPRPFNKEKYDKSYKRIFGHE